jgi:hypothetical protein
MESFLAFLDATGGTITRLALGAFLVVNAAFIVAVLVRRDRRLVDHWTRRLVVLDTALLLAAGGAPVATWAARTATRAVALVLPDPPAATANAPGSAVDPSAP